MTVIYKRQHTYQDNLYPGSTSLSVRVCHKHEYFDPCKGPESGQSRHWFVQQIFSKYILYGSHLQEEISLILYPRKERRPEKGKSCAPIHRAGKQQSQHQNSVSLPPAQGSSQGENWGFHPEKMFCFTRSLFVFATYKLEHKFREPQTWPVLSPHTWHTVGAQRCWAGRVN